jgi:RNA ligase (TIGR02306 family)
MATLKCEVVKLRIQEHPNADAIEIAQVRGYQSIVKKGQFKTGDLAVYIPEQSVLPPWVLRRLNMWDEEKGKGGLAGSKGNRVKAVQLRGVTSQGLLLPLSYKAPRTDIILYNDEGWFLENENGYSKPVWEGKDVTELLGVVKYEPPIPVHMTGEVVNVHGKTLKYDIENIKNYPSVAEALMTFGIECSITEKIHGTFCLLGFYPENVHDEIPRGNVLIGSKGLAAKGLVFKDNDANTNNLYMRAFKAHDKWPNMDTVEFKEPIFLLGEVFGKGVQDLQYGLNDIEFRLFDVYFGKPGEGSYADVDQLEEVASAYGLKTVPELFRGPLTPQIIAEYTDGLDTITGSHIREGIVIKPVQEMRNIYTGRTILKSVSERYLNRRNATEYN